MIQLTRLNRQPFTVNSDLIKFIERSPDTVLSLTTGEKIVVVETPDEVVQKMIVFRKALLADVSPVGGGRDSALTKLAVYNADASSPNKSEESSRG